MFGLRLLISTIFGFYVFIVLTEAKPQAPGGLQDDAQALNEVTDVFKNFKEVNKEVKRKILQLPGVKESEVLGDIQVLAAKTQVVAGFNYYVKIKIGNLFFHVRVFRDLEDIYIVKDVKGPLPESTPLNIF